MNDAEDISFAPIFAGATLGVLLEIIATLVDEIVVGNILNDSAFAAVNLIEPFTLFENFVAYLVTVAGAALIMRANGAKDHNKMEELFSQTMILCGICGSILTLIYVLFTPGLVHFVANDPAVYDYALDYFNMIRFYPFVDMFDTFLFAYVLYRGGNVQFYSAIVLRIGANALLSWQLGLRMGIAGIGLASILSLLIALAVKLTFLLSSKHGLSFRWYFDLGEVFELIRLGFPESFISVCVVVMELFLNRFTLDNYGVAGVAAVALVINIFEFTLYLSEGISEFELVAVNDSIGKSSSRSMDRAVKITKRAAYIEGLVLVVIIFCASGVLPEAFDIDDKETARLAAVMLKIIAPSVVFICMSRITAIFYQYTKRLTRTLILFGMSITVLPVLFGEAFGRIRVEGIAIGMAAGPAVAMFLMYLFVRYIRKEGLFDYELLHLNG